MSRKSIISISAVAVLIIAFLTFQVLQIRSELNSTKASLEEKTGELNALQTNLQQTDTELKQTHDELNDTIDDLNMTKDKLDQTTDKLNRTEDELQSTRTELTVSRAEISSLDFEVASLQINLDDANESIASLNENLDLYRETFGEVYSGIEPIVNIHDTLPPPLYFELPDTPTPMRNVYLVNNPGATNPSYDELLSFLDEDTTDLNVYLTDYYVCGNFAETVHNNAEATGIRAAFVIIYFDDGTGHAINAFLTTDEDLVYIDCTGSDTYQMDTMDTYVYDLKPGNQYQRGFLVATDLGFVPEDRLVTEIKVYW